MNTQPGSFSDVPVTRVEPTQKNDLKEAIIEVVVYEQNGRSVVRQIPVSEYLKWPA